MEIQPRKELEKLLKNVKAKALLDTVKKLDQKGRDIVVQGLTTRLDNSKKQALLNSLRQSVSQADAEIREWLVQSISESYIHGMNLSTRLATLNAPSGTALYKWTDATPQVDTLWEKIRAISGDSAGTVGDGMYFSLDQDSSKQFGNVLHSYTLPSKYKLYDTTLQSNQVTVGGVKMSKLQHEMMKKVGSTPQDLIAYAKSKGYDGVIFEADDGVSKWVGINEDVAKVGLIPFIPKMTPLTVDIIKGSAEYSPHLNAINALLSDAYLDFGNAMTSFTRSGERMLNDALKRQIRSNIIEGRLEGDAIREITKTVKETFINKGFIGLTDRSGREWTIDSYAEMLTRTHIIRANNEGTINQAKDFDVDIVEVSTHASACPICQPYEGKFFSISGKDSKYPALAGNEPPFHPNCKHSLYYRPDLGSDRE